MPDVVDNSTGKLIEPIKKEFGRFKKMEEIEPSMSNCYLQIDEGMESGLMERPGEVYSHHAGWEFYGYVYYENGMFHEEVWRYGSPQTIISEPSLKELMTSVNNIYGWK